jgi:hypothetical protein
VLRPLGHGFADQVFRKADFARGGILVLAEAHIDRVILGQHAAFDQQADRAPAAATGVDIVEGLLARRWADDQRLQQAVFGDAGGQGLKARVAVGFADIALGKAQLGVRQGGGLHDGVSRAWVERPRSW